MARANRASYKTCFVFRRDNDRLQESTYLNHDGVWVPNGTKENPFQIPTIEKLVKCFDRESADAIVSYIQDSEQIASGFKVMAEETVCDIVQELQLYSFVEAFVQDLRRARI